MIAPTPGTTPDQAAPSYTPAQQEIKSGFELLQQGKTDEAIQHFNEALKISPQEPLAYVALGLADRQLNRFDDAIEAFSSAINLLPDNDDRAETYLRRGIVWFYKGEYGIAWDDFDEAAGLLVEDPLPHLWKGLARARQDRWLEAVNSYATALELNPRFELAYINRGLAYLALDEPNKAVRDFNQAVRQEPKNAGTYFKRGVALGRLGRYREAVDSYTQALRLNPSYAEAYFNRSLANRRLGDAAQADKDRAAAVKINPQIEKQLTSAG